jgi:hypothetical protein
MSFSLRQRSTPVIILRRGCGPPLLLIGNSPQASDPGRLVGLHVAADGFPVDAGEPGHLTQRLACKSQSQNFLDLDHREIPPGMPFGQFRGLATGSREATQALPSGPISGKTLIEVVPSS